MHEVVRAVEKVNNEINIATVLRVICLINLQISLLIVFTPILTLKAVNLI